jgi:hypothetical protein
MTISKEKLDLLVKNKLKTYKTKSQWEELVEQTCYAIKNHHYGKFKKLVYENIDEKEMNAIIMFALKAKDIRFIHFLIFEKQIETKLNKTMHGLFCYHDEMVLFFLKNWDYLKKNGHIAGTEVPNVKDLKIQWFYYAVKEGRFQLLEKLYDENQKKDYDFNVAFLNALSSEDIHTFSFVVDKMKEEDLKNKIYNFLACFEKDSNKKILQEMMRYLNESRKIYEWEDIKKNMTILDFKECLYWFNIYKNKEQINQELNLDVNREELKKKLKI